MEATANAYLQRKQWSTALEIYTRLLHSSNITKQQAVAYLLARSECYRELAQHELVADDCRKVIHLLSDQKGDENEFRARRRLVYALFAQEKLIEAECTIKQWLMRAGQHTNEEVTRVFEEMYSHFVKDKKYNLYVAKNGFRYPFPNGTKIPKAVPMDLFVCTYCNVSFKDKMELREHCQLEAHQRVIMSDEGREWLYRAPPRGNNSETYALCESFSETRQCRYGMQCVDAHGSDELAEWQERFKYRLMKLERAYEKELYGKSYTEELLKDWINSPNPDTIMKGNLDHVNYFCAQELVNIMSTKNSVHEWHFRLKLLGDLYSVALLQDTHRNHFELSSITYKQLLNGVKSTQLNLRDKQEWISKDDNEPADVLKEYNVRVNFKTDIYGTFRQSIVFDFGSRPVLVKHLCVDVMPVTDAKKINDIKKEIILSNVDRWNHSNCNLVPFSSLLSMEQIKDSETLWTSTLNEMYPCPSPETFVLSQTTVIEKRLNRQNYKSRMHELLYVEEMARYEQVAMYNVKVKLTIAQCYVLMPASNAASSSKYSNCGELFALIRLGKELSEDTAAGRLVLNNCSTVLVSQDFDSKHPTVYECPIEDKGKKVIYLRLSARMVSDLKLNPEAELTANIQFQLNRIPYCQWHYAIDRISDLRIIYPDVLLEPLIPWNPNKLWENKILNARQRQALVTITAPLSVQLPPILIIGPYGTGKTFTLAQAIKQLSSSANHKILICTHSNSAADLYIKDYLDPYVLEGNAEARPLRIYYQKRWIATVNETVQKYCLIDPSTRSFRTPTMQDIDSHRIIVVTLSISMNLATLGLPKGYFTHILLDEAAQAMECEAIMPLALADETTRIVLAGDHMQLSPEISSPFAEERRFHLSLLERLYDHYPGSHPCKILLVENYRAHEAIVDFTSQSFYDQKLVASGKQPRHDVFYPLTFFTTRGEDVQDQNSTAFYNNAEVYEIAERVGELKKMWPPNWGAFNEQSIGVMSPYADQVFRIRVELRKRKLFEISVERILNVQGKQFRVVFLSTVRTRRTCAGSSGDLDFGLLSNSKLLNTAISRAQSLVAVVGDPVALCSVGRCSKLWENFIQVCNENRSLHGITWSQLRNQLDGVELKKSYVLNPLAPEFVPRKYYIGNRISYIPPPPPQPTFQKMTIPPPALDRAVLSQIRGPVMPVPPPIGRPPPLQPNFAIYTTPQKPFVPNLVPALAPGPIITNPMVMPGNNILPSSKSIASILQGFHPMDQKLPLMVSMNAENQEKAMIQFTGNVHFPEMVQNSHINLLPPNMTLSDMMYLPFKSKEMWYNYLLETRGVDTAKKFEFLINATMNKQPVLQNAVQSVASPCKSYVKSESSHDPSWYNKPVDQLNVNEPVYLVDNRPAVQGAKEQETRRSAQRVENRNGTLSHSSQYLNKDWIDEINAQFSNLRVGETIEEPLSNLTSSLSFVNSKQSANIRDSRFAKFFS